MSNVQFSKIIVGTSLVMLGLFVFQNVFAGSPSGADTFQLLTDKTTGGDNTGDGGTGAAGDLNYYYVGQFFTTTFEIVSGGTSAANIWIDYNSVTTTASDLSIGSYFGNWSGKTINANARGTGLGRIYSTGANIPVTQSAGTGNFGSVRWTMNRPTAAGYGEGSPETLDINVGTIGQTTESNISLSGVDLLDDEEDFQFHIWADTIKPFAENPSPTNGLTSVSVDSNYTFDLRDTKNGEGDNMGVGTGMNTSEPPGALTFNDGGGAVSYTAYDSFSCSGVWGTNYCGVTVNPPSPLAISGDSRNWKYSTTYTATIGGFQDLASSNQDQLGDANGPNTMDTKVYTFTTEADTIAPRVTSETPTRASAGNSVSTNITIEVTDRKTYPSGPSGTGVDASTCQINVTSASFPLTTYSQGHANVTATAIDYGYRFVINPASDFGENETVSVSVYDCEDLASNVMTTDNYTFTTADTQAPYVDSRSPADDASIDADGTVSFHLKDDGVGTQLSTVAVYVNGQYWTDGGGAGSVTTNGTRVTYASSKDFNGGNYVGDTTSVAGSASDYTFTIDPEMNFTDGEAVPVIIYARDTYGNIMERDVYALVVGGGSTCADGSTYCGDNTTYTGGQCVGTGGGSIVSIGGGGGGGSAIIPKIREETIQIVQVDETTVHISWFTNRPGTARVLYDVFSHKNIHEIYTDPPNYDYEYSTEEYNDAAVYHAVTISGLTTGGLYYFKPISIMDGHQVFGPEVQMAPKFATEIVEQKVVEEKIVYQQQECPQVPVVSRGENRDTSVPTDTPVSGSGQAGGVAVTSCDCSVCNQQEAPERIVYRDVFREIPIQVCVLPPEDQHDQNRYSLILARVQDKDFNSLDTDIISISQSEKTITFSGYAEPNTTVTMAIY